MLHQSAVPLNLLQVLRDLGEPIAASDFALAGGTSLALRLGHRLSVDLDFFTTGGFDPVEWAARIGAKADSTTGIADGTLQLLMNGVKVEFLNHSYPKLAPYEIAGSLRMWSLEDIAGMKLNAIANGGSKKDFHDIAALLERFPLDAMVGHYQAKYQPDRLVCTRAFAGRPWPVRVLRAHGRRSGSGRACRNPSSTSERSVSLAANFPSRLPRQDAESDQGPDHRLEVLPTLIAKAAGQLAPAQRTFLIRVQCDLPRQFQSLLDLPGIEMEHQLAVVAAGQPPSSRPGPVVCPHPAHVSQDGHCHVGCETTKIPSVQSENP
jgi:hypothetical protein